MPPPPPKKKKKKKKDPRCPLHIAYGVCVCVCSDIFCSKGREAPKTNWYDTNFNFPMANVMFVCYITYAYMCWKNIFIFLELKVSSILAGPRSAVGNVSGYRCVSDCRSRGREFDPGPVPYFREDWSWNDFYGHSPPFRWFIQERFLSVTSESMCTNYWLTACSSLPRKKCG